jgi:hypothetical protein
MYPSRREDQRQQPSICLGNLKMFFVYLHVRLL